MSKKRDPDDAEKKLAHAEDVPLATPEELTELDLAALSDSGIPRADAEALDVDIPTASASSSNLFGSDLPSASPASSDSDVANLDVLGTVQPASGWFESQAGDLAQPGTDVFEANLGGPLSGTVEGSDIFGGPMPAAKPKSDVSDVIAATAYRSAKPATDAPKVKVKVPASPTSDIALSFDRPPGGSTVQDAAAEADLPVADESDSLFGGEEESSRPPKSTCEDADLGSSPVGTIDASSIMADLSEPGSVPGDSSAIRLEAPGLDVTLQDDEHAEFTRGGTEPDMNLPTSSGSGDPDHWHSQSGSDLFADAHTRHEFELLPDTGSVDPFADEFAVDQPSLSTAPSSIFSGGKLPGGSGIAPSSGGSFPVANPESTDSVEFSDHPDPNAADSGSFHVLPAGAVDFDMADDPHPERSMRMDIPEDEDDWAGAKTDPGASSASADFSRRKKIDPTDEMAPVPATPMKSKPTAEIKKKDPSMVVDWVASDESPAGAKSRPSQPRERAPSEPGVNKRGLAGLALGLLLGVGVSAGAYFSGVLPNKEGSKTIVNDGGGTASTEALAAAEKRAADLKTASDALAADLKTETDKAATAEKTLLAEKDKATTAEKNLLAEKEKTTTVEKTLLAEKEKATTAEKNLVAEKGKTTAVEKNLLAEKEKSTTAEKNLVAEKDKVVTVEKDLKAEKAKTTDLVKATDELKETYKKNEAATRKEVQRRDDLLDQAKFDVRKRDDEIARLKDTLAVRAAGPDLRKLIPADLSAVAGTGLTTGHILDLGSRANKSDAAIKAASADIAKLKADQTVEMKSMADAFKKSVADMKDAQAVELKKVADSTTAVTDKLKTEHAAKLKEAADQYTLDVKKATDANAEKVKGLEVAIAAEKGRVAEAERRLKAVGGTTSVAAQQLDWAATQAAARSLDAGIAAYKSGRFDVAEKALAEAAKQDHNDALAWYYLGATRWAQGKSDEAKADFKQGAEREALRLLTARQLDDQLSPIQGSARDALTAARP